MLTNEALSDRLRVAVGRLARKLRQQSLGGLTPSQRSILATLGRHGPLGMSRLAEIEGISPPSTSGIVARLVDKGLVERQADPADGRSAIIELTPEAVAQLEQRRRERSAFLMQRIETLTDEERSTLADAVEVLEHLIDDA